MELLKSFIIFSVILILLWKCYMIEQIRGKDHVEKESRNTQENGNISGNIRKVCRLKLILFFTILRK